MILARHLGARLLGWVGLALALLLALAALAGAVESARHGGALALRLALLEAPVLVLPLVPLCVALGSGVTAARLQARGEALALEAMGIPPQRTALVALGLGLLIGGLGTLAHGRLVGRLADEALALRAQVEDQPSDAGWLWTGEGAVRVADGLGVKARLGRIVEIVPGQGSAGPGLARQARALSWPSLAGAAELARDDLPLPLRVERQERRIRPLATGLLALLAWLGPLARIRARVGPALGLAVGWQAAMLGLSALAAQGKVPASLPALSGLGLLVLLAAWRLRSGLSAR